MVKTVEATDHRLAQKIRIEHENLVSYFIPRGLLLERSAQKQLLHMTDSCIDRAHRFFLSCKFTGFNKGNIMNGFQSQ